MEFFTSDTHFGHDNIIIHDKRPFKTVQEMDETIIENWNKTVKPIDEIWHLGDFCFRADKPASWYLSKLHGRIHIVWGNHDDKEAKKFSHLFSSTQDSKYLRINGQKITLYHYAQRSWRAMQKGAWMLHGHSHHNLPDYGKSLDVGTNGHNYTPISFDMIKEILDKREIIKTGEENELDLG